MGEKAEEALTELNNCPNGISRPLKGLMIESKEVEGGICLGGCDGNRQSLEGLYGNNLERRK